MPLRRASACGSGAGGLRAALPRHKRETEMRSFGGQTRGGWSAHSGTFFSAGSARLPARSAAAWRSGGSPSAWRTTFCRAGAAGVAPNRVDVLRSHLLDVLPVVAQMLENNIALHRTAPALISIVTGVSSLV